MLGSVCLTVEGSGGKETAGHSAGRTERTVSQFMNMLC